MYQDIPPVYFYTPNRYCTETLPTCPNTNWRGFGLGIHAWILQTYLWLKALALPCEFVTDIPDSGIVFVHHNALREVKKALFPTPDRIIVCVNAESLPCPSAQLQIVQNPLQVNLQQGCYFLPHWPQPGLIPRHPERKAMLKNVAFLGHEKSLAPELQNPSWEKELMKMGLHWCPVINHNRWDRITNIDDRWNDYSQLDLIVAIRSFDRKQLQIHRRYYNKPATKLYNAWLAGTPAILGQESAYQSLRQSEFDYIEVETLEEIFIAIQKLQRHPDYYFNLIEQGHERASTIQPDAIAQQWLTFLKETVFPYYEQWCAQKAYRRILSLYRKYWTFTSYHFYEKARKRWIS